MLLKINELKNNSDFEFKELSSTKVELVKYYGNKSHIEIPTTFQGKFVTSIRNWAFRNCTSLKTVTIPDSVTSIGEGAFWNCTSLKTVTIPDSVTSIGEWAFWNCPKLKEVILNPYSEKLKKLVKVHFKSYSYKITFKDIKGNIL